MLTFSATQQPVVRRSADLLRTGRQLGLANRLKVLILATLSKG
jgi:hypothetical protein